jgi:CrcB protein
MANSEIYPVQTYLWIALGGALGSVARYWLSGVMGQRLGEAFPWGTILVNVTGSFLIGAFATVTSSDGRWLAGAAWRPFFMAGVCGGYTTFSTFSLQTLNLARGGEWLSASANVVLSVVLCLFGVWLGHLLGIWFNGGKGG